MNKFRIYVDNRPKSFVWALDQYDAVSRYIGDSGISRQRVYAVEIDCDETYY